jgi:hypothetical protein
MLLPDLIHFGAMAIDMRNAVMAGDKDTRTRRTPKDRGVRSVSAEHLREEW